MFRWNPNTIVGGPERHSLIDAHGRQHGFVDGHVSPRGEAYWLVNGKADAAHATFKGAKLALLHDAMDARHDDLRALGALLDRERQGGDHA